MFVMPSILQTDWNSFSANWDLVLVSREIIIPYLQICTSNNATVALRAVILPKAAVYVNLVNQFVITARSCFSLRVFGSGLKVSIAIASRSCAVGINLRRLWYNIRVRATVPFGCDLLRWSTKKLPPTSYNVHIAMKQTHQCARIEKCQVITWLLGIDFY